MQARRMLAVGTDLAGRAGALADSSTDLAEF